MKTEFWLAAQYDGRVVIPVGTVCADYFTHLSVDSFLRKVSAGEIKLPIIRMDGSQKAARGVHVEDLAHYLDDLRKAAKKECEQLAR